MTFTGRVIDTNGTNAVVKTARPKSCEHCSSAALCGKKDLEVTAINRIGADVGDFVTVETNEDRTAPAILAYLFLVPIAILFFTYFLFTLSPLLALSAIPQIAAYYAVLRLINRKHTARAEILSPALEPENCEKP